MSSSLCNFWKTHKRDPLWAAPVFWQILYSCLALWFGFGSYFGAIFRETRLNWMLLPPYNSIIIGLGAFGLVSTFLRYHKLHVVHGIGTVFLLSYIFLTYISDLALNAQTTGVYGLLLVGAVWLCARLAVDEKIIVTWTD